MVRYIQILGRQKRPLRFLISRALRLTGLYRSIYMDFGDYKLRLHPSSLSLALWVDKRDRGGDCSVVRSLLRKGETYVDIGANIGQLVMEGVASVGESGKVFAFEAHPRIAGYLRENLELNGAENVRVAQVAVGDRFGWASFSDGRSDDQNKIAGDGIFVPMVRLSSFFENEKIDLLKIDVEGYEKFVLMGLGDSLNNTSIVYFEVMDAHFHGAGYSFRDVHSLLTDKGFQIFAMNGERIREVHQNEKFPVCLNLFATRDAESLCQKLGASRGA